MWCENMEQTGWCRSLPLVRWQHVGVIRDVGRVLDLPVCPGRYHCKDDADMN